LTRCQHCGAQNADDARFCGACGQATAATQPSSAGGAAASAPAPDLVGREIGGRFRILAKLGEGGMGAVYRGEQMSLKRRVAIKLLHPDLSKDPALVRRFNAEAELVAKLSHPNTVNIYDFGQDRDGLLFIAMEYLEGRSLRQAVSAEGPLPVRRALHIVGQVAASIADAHHHGIVHRDLKPDNVMLTERGRDRDVVRVLDFGIAKLRDEQNKAQTQNPMTRQGDLVGTPQYMAPEQIRGEPVDGRTDVYALGTILYEMVTGRLPFEGPSLMAILSRHLLDTPEAPTVRRPDLGLPPAIDVLVMQMLAKDPAHRIASMDAVGERIAQLAASLGGAPVHAPTPPGARLSRPPGVPITLPPGQMYATPMTPPPHAVLPPQPYTTPQPYPTPPAPAPAKQGSLLWLWVLLALVAAAGAVGAVIALTRSKPAAEESGGGGGRPPHAVHTPPRHVVAIAGYQIVMPLGFIEAAGVDRGIGGDVETRIYTGSIDGNIATVHAFGNAENLQHSQRDELDDGCGDIARAYFGGSVTGSRMVSGGGAQLYRCSIAGDAQTIEGAFYSGAAGTLVVFFAADPAAWSALGPAREALFERGVTTSSSSR
jgi:serine/threonine-protein kinase